MLTDNQILDLAVKVIPNAVQLNEHEGQPESFWMHRDEVIEFARAIEQRCQPRVTDEQKAKALKEFKEADIYSELPLHEDSKRTIIDALQTETIEDLLAKVPEGWKLIMVILRPLNADQDRYRADIMRKGPKFGEAIGYGPNVESALRAAIEKAKA